jgi:hypothetical protein
MTLHQNKATSHIIKNTIIYNPETFEVWHGGHESYLYLKTKG